MFDLDKKMTLETNQLCLHGVLHWKTVFRAEIVFLYRTLNHYQRLRAQTKKLFTQS